MGALFNPLGQRGDFIFRQWIALRRHDVVAGIFPDAENDRAFVRIARSDARPIVFASLESSGVLIESEVA